MNELFDFLDRSFPNRLPLKHISDYELGELVGQQRLINILKERFKVNIKEEEER